MILDLPYILETRRNHALEHASLHMLARAHPAPMAGHSNPTGFFILGDFTLEEIYHASDEARIRLNAGESGLAIHEGCGTNIATSALLAYAFGGLPLRGRSSSLGKIAALPFAVALGFVGYCLARPLGPKLQQHVTTQADLGNLQIVDIRYVRKGVHRVITKN